jgi:hypothetical protein
LVPRTQEGVGAAHPGELLALQLRVEVDHLHQAMHAGVGAAGADGGEGDGGEALEGGFEVVLHGAAGRLALPAVVGLAVVADAEGDPHEGDRSKRRLAVSGANPSAALR